MPKSLLTFFILFICFSVKAQQPNQPKSILTDEHLLLKDSTGKLLEYKDWKPLILSGDYTIRSRYTATDTTHTLHHLTAEEKQRVANLRAQYAPSGQAQQPSAFSQFVNLGPAPRASEAFPIGTKMNMLSGKAMDGLRIDKKTTAGKIVVVNFWFIGCPPCKAEIPELNNLAAENAGNTDIIFVAVGLDKIWEVKDFIKQKPFNYHHITEASRLCQSYGVNLFPTNVIIDKKGIIRYSAVSYTKSYIAWMKKTIEEIRKEN
jgi:thiol-disulfide isomerase/thioredoxin